MRLVSLLGLSVAFASSALGCAASAEPGAQGDQGGGGESTAATSEDLKANGIFSIKSQAFGCVAQDSIGRAVIRRLGFHDAVALLDVDAPLVALVVRIIEDHLRLGVAGRVHRRRVLGSIAVTVGAGFLAASQQRN